MADPETTPAESSWAAEILETTNELVRRFYAELRQMAVGMGRESHSCAPLEPTALVHEAYLRLSRGAVPRWENRRHFFGAAARAMREILVEQYRRRECAKHGGGRTHVPLQDVHPAIVAPSEDLLALDEAITRLDRQDPRLGEGVRLRYFAGLTVEQTADVLGQSLARVKRDWRFIKAWLASELKSDNAGGSGPARKEEP